MATIASLTLLAVAQFIGSRRISRAIVDTRIGSARVRIEPLVALSG